MIYRQRLTGWGWIGACAAVGAPVLLGPIIGNWAGNLGNQFYVPRFPAVLTMVLGIATTVGWIMLLVGREHYAVREEPVLKGNGNGNGNGTGTGNASHGPFVQPVK